ncbi:MAG TPA: hypothetical protein DEB31_06970 [Clostridiales bacterium]|nr:hypothetical protein [Clostridiales bacterium]
MKKRDIFYCVAADILGIAIVPINLFLFSIPEYSTIIISVLIIAAMVCFFIKHKGRAVSKTILSILAVVCVMFTLFGAYCNPYWNSLLFKDYEYALESGETLSLQQAKADLDYVRHYLQKDHPLYIDGMPEEMRQAFDRAADELGSSGAITVSSLEKTIQGVLAPLDDAHTACWRYEEVAAAGESGGTAPQSFVYYEIDADKNLAVLTLHNCWFNEEYRDCLQAMFTEVKEAGIDNVAVDLRNNGGGSSLVATEFIKYLDTETYKTGTYEWRFGMFMLPSGDGIVRNEKNNDLLFTGSVYVLTSPETFSSAMLFAQYIKDNHLGIIVGEASGQTASHYGEVASFTLPNSKLVFGVSTKYMWRADKESEDAFVSPDIPCDAESALDVLEAYV